MAGIGSIETHRFKNDAQTRRRLYTSNSFSHPAKGHLGMWALMIERYSKPGDAILDPMSGSGATLLAALMGRNVICVELEPHFVDPMRRSWEKMRNIPMLGYHVGQAVILRGDARCLPLPDASVDVETLSPPYEGMAVTAGDQARSPSILFPEGERTDRGKIKRDGLFERGYTRPVDAIVTSPPYEESLHPGQACPGATADDAAHSGASASRAVDSIITSPPFEEQNIRNVGEEPYGSKRYGGMARQIKNTNRYTRAVDAIVTSPPFQDQNPHHGGGHTDFTPIGGIGHEKVIQGGYTRKPVDAIVTSPPFQERKAYEGQPNRPGSHIQQGGFTTLPHAVSSDMENIGNLRSDAYWDAMHQVYTECWRVLKPGGIMALVLKGFVRSGVYQDLPSQTETLLLEAGWVKHDHWRRELWSLSFWRILQRRRDPAAFDDRLNYEEVIAFRKPEVEVPHG